MHTHTYTYVYIHIHRHIHTYAYIDIHTYTYIYIEYEGITKTEERNTPQGQGCTHMHALHMRHIQISTYADIQTCTGTYSLIHAHACMNMYVSFVYMLS